MYKQGDILLIPIPFSDLTSSKKRPVLVLSNSKYNKVTEDILVVAITSNLEEKEYAVIITNEDMEEGALKVDSCVRTDKIYTLSKFIVIKKIGSIKTDIINQIKVKLHDLLEEKP
ncbi:MAG: type II toxin-antitoxin system PemK/MazF family toxin [Bacillota bacterium]|nr:type II toxin-antitoxin system PemK/MazF family toxin [Bacillota bacterium]